MGFPGFSRDLIAFLGALRDNNSKDWFDANREQYERLFKQPALDFITAFEPVARAFDPPLRAEARLNGSLRRLFRDTRFSKDKTPYHTHLHLVFWSGDHPNRSPGLHVVLEADHFGFGVGHWAFDKQGLQNYREAICDARWADALLEALETARAGGAGELDPPQLTRIPKGFDADPRHADLLRHKGLVVRTSIPYPDGLFDGRAVDTVAAYGKALMPFHTWLARTLAGQKSG